MQELVWITMYITPWLLVGTVTMTQQMKMMSASWICARSTTFDLPSKDFPSLVVGSGPGCTQVDLNTSWIIYWLTASGSFLSGTAVLTTQLNWTLTTALLPSFWSLAWELARESHAREQKLQDQRTREESQLELSNRFQALHLTDVSVDITERYKSFRNNRKGSHWKSSRHKRYRAMWSTNLGIWQDNPPDEGER